jgi:CubicO group peptidase (beta-lactamase class C family)
MSRRIALLLVVVVALLIAAGARYWHTAQRPEPGAVMVAGGDAGGLPRSDPDAEGFDAKALQAAVELARARPAGGLLVMRHGHLVVEHYFGDADAQTLLDGGEFSSALLMVAVGIAIAQYGAPPPALSSGDAAALAAFIAKSSGRAYPQFLSRNVWQPLNAAPARCTGFQVSARPVDWLRVAEMLLHDGRFEGTQVAPAGWVLRLRPSARGEDRPGTGLHGKTAAAGAEPFASDDTFFLRGPGATRLWLVPRLDLVILSFGGPGTDRPDESRLANALIRALRDRPPSTGVDLRDLVPNH